MSGFDYIIIGAGSAGCVLANRLSSGGGHRVLLLEAGGRDLNPWIHVPVGYFKTIHNSRTDWCYKTAPIPSLNGRILDWPRGKVLGGSSSINGLLYIRGHRSDYDHWRQLGNEGWSYDDVLPYFIRSEDYELGADSFHGCGGGLSVSTIRSHRDICDAFISGAVELGLPRRDDFNGARQEGAGYFQTTTRNGFRCSTAVGFLRPVMSRSNLEVVTGAHVKGLLFSDLGDVSGVRYSVGGRGGSDREIFLRSGGEVILSAGSIGSPQILQLSGIGPGSVLHSHGICVRRDLPGVGENLQDHLQIRMVYELNVPTLNDEINSIFRRILMGLDYIFRRRGAMTMGASQVCIFCRTDRHLIAPDIQFHFQPFSADKPGVRMHSFSGVTSSVCQLRPESRGRVMISSSDPYAYPQIDPNYLSSSYDEEIVVRGMRFSRSLMGSSSMSGFVVREHLPGSDYVSDSDLLSSARDLAQTIYHPTGTCKMGSDRMSVVDDRLRVHGVGNLRVVDASIMPEIVSGNTNAPTIMIAEKASDMILSDRA